MSTQQDFRPETSGPAIGTIVWGAVVIVVGALMLANRFGWFSIDPGYAAAGILLLAGLGLVIGGIAASRRRRALTDDGAGAAPAGDLTDASPSVPAPHPNPYESTSGPRDERPGATD